MPSWAKSSAIERAARAQEVTAPALFSSRASYIVRAQGVRLSAVFGNSSGRFDEDAVFRSGGRAQGGRRRSSITWDNDS
jgi:hypothetical protein